MFNFGMIPELSTKHDIMFKCGCVIDVSGLGYSGHIKLCPLLSHAFYDTTYTVWDMSRIPRLVKGSRIWTPIQTKSIDFAQML